MRATILWALLWAAPACTYDWVPERDGELSDAATDEAPDARARADAGRGDARRPDASDTGTNDSQSPNTLTCDDCDPAASCTPGATRICTCPDQTRDEQGDGTRCSALCDCDEHATCSVQAGVATCACAGDYVGDGKVCTFDESCSQLACDANAACEVSGKTRACKCRPGFTGDGSSCTDIHECSGPVCGANGTCMETPGSFMCQCKPGYSGAACEIDACVANPCASGSSCVHNSTGVSCVPACAPNCAAGKACTADDQCVTGAICHPTGKVCVLRTCGGGEIAFQGDIDRYKFCQSIGGSVNIKATPTPLTSWSMPYLKAITGSLSSESVGGSVNSPGMQFEALESIGGDLSIGNIVGTDSFSAPQLKSVAGNLIIGMSVFLSIDLGRLQTVGKDMGLVALQRANSISVGSLKSVTGTVTVTVLPSVSWATISNLNTLGSSRSISGIGCAICPLSTTTAYGCGDTCTSP